MSIIDMKSARWLVLLITVSALSGEAWAQEVPTDRFFADKVTEAEAEGEEPGTIVQGSLTSSTFYYSESGDEMVQGNNIVVQNASPVSRLYTELRGQLDARNMIGGAWTARVDSRARLSPNCEFQSGFYNRANTPECNNQSGLYGANEYDVRELYVRRAGETLDLQLGRQYVLELSAFKIDGLRVEYQTSENLSIVAFGGLHPARGSRSITEDYPTQQFNGVDSGERVMPVAGGAAGSYRYRSLYGAVGAVAVLPMANEPDPAQLESNVAEPNRFFVTANGYWRQSNQLDIYHYAVVDLQSSAGTGLTNLSAGVNYRPTSTLRVTGSVNRVDTETLAALSRTEQGQLGNNIAAVQNNVDVARTASLAIRGGVSAALRDQRFQLSASAAFRSRPELTVYNANTEEVALDAAQSIEILLQAVDRRSFKGFRLGASILASFGFGEMAYANAETRLIRLSGSREFAEGRGQYDLSLNYLSSTDDGERASGQLCLNNMDCLGTSSISTIGLGGTAYYRFRANWFGMATAEVARQGFSPDGMNSATNLLLTAFLRAAYRF